MVTYAADAAEVDIFLTPGDDETFSITREKDDGTAIDISNWKFWLTVKNSPEEPDSDAVVQKTITSHTDPKNGKTEIHLASSDTEDLEQSYYWDMQYKTDAGTVKTFVIGMMHFGAEVTEATS